MPISPPPPPPQHPSRQALVTKAVSFNGVCDGKGYDCPNPFSADLGRPTESWCADFVTDMFKRTGGDNPAKGPPPLPANASAMGPISLPSMQSGCKTGFAYVPSAWEYALARKATYSSWQAQPGDIVVFGFGSTVPQHTGLVVEWKSGVLYTVEGNSGNDGGVNREQYSAPSGVGNNNIIGIIDSAKLVTFGTAAAAAAAADIAPASARAATIGDAVPPHAPPAQFKGETRDLALTSPMMEGADVTAVQKALASHGENPGAVDGVFNPATADAVIAFQGKAKLEANGIVDQATRTALGL